MILGLPFVGCLKKGGILIGEYGGVGSSLIVTYSECGIIGDALKMFDEIFGIKM